jgi:hypothetical protein
MSGKIIKDTVVAITGVAATGIITVASTAGIYERAYGYLNATGQVPVFVQVANVLSATTFNVRQITDPRGGGAVQSGDGSTTFTGAGNYSNFNPSAYTVAASITFPYQIVMNSNENPLV